MCSQVQVTNMDFVLSGLSLNWLFRDHSSSSKVLGHSVEHNPKVSIQEEHKIRVVSSAKMSMVVGCGSASGRSIVCIRNRSGERMDPCGTPCVRVWGKDCG